VCELPAETRSLERAKSDMPQQVMNIEKIYSEKYTGGFLTSDMALPSRGLKWLLSGRPGDASNPRALAGEITLMAPSISSRVTINCEGSMARRSALERERGIRAARREQDEMGRIEQDTSREQVPFVYLGVATAKRPQCRFRGEGLEVGTAISNRGN
jgi:hypothetical protein